MIQIGLVFDIVKIQQNMCMYIYIYVCGLRNIYIYGINHVDSMCKICVCVV